MGTVLCVLYDDPVDGYPPAYARDDFPKIERYPDAQTTPTPSATGAFSPDLPSRPPRSPRASGGGWLIDR